jgi:hypothetical protein
VRLLAFAIVLVAFLAIAGLVLAAFILREATLFMVAVAGAIFISAAIVWSKPTDQLW